MREKGGRGSKALAFTLASFDDSNSLKHCHPINGVFSKMTSLFDHNYILKYFNRILFVHEMLGDFTLLT